MTWREEQELLEESKNSKAKRALERRMNLEENKGSTIHHYGKDKSLQRVICIYNESEKDPLVNFYGTGILHYLFHYMRNSKNYDEDPMKIFKRLLDNSGCLINEPSGKRIPTTQKKSVRETIEFLKEFDKSHPDEVVYI